MKGVWVRKRYPKQYTPKYHFHKDDGWTKTKAQVWPGAATQWDYVQSMTGKSLCGRFMAYHGKEVMTYQLHGKNITVRKGGLLFRKKIRLNQRNLCWFCLVKFMKDQPKEIQKAFAILNKAR